MDLRADPDGLRADAGALDASGHQSAPASACQAAAGDSVSAHLASALSAWSDALHLLHEHGGQQRAIGAMALGGTAADLAGADDANAAAIGGILDGAAPSAGAAPAAPSAGAIPNVPAPSLPAIPTMPTPMPMAPEQIAAQVHSGPGPQSLRTFAAHIRNTLAPSVLNAADEVRRTGTSVAQNWVDGQQQAATNIAGHADWLESSLHPQVLALASAAETVADHTETLIQNTPRPEELTDLRQRLQIALANFTASRGANATQVDALKTQLTTKRAATMSALQDFSTAAPPTIGGAAKPPPPAPPIVHNPSGPEAHKLNPQGPTAPDGDHDGPAQGRGHHGEGDHKADDITSSDHPPISAPAAPANPAQAAPLAGADPNSASTLANVAGMIMGAGTGAVGQVTHGLGGASPLSALSSLSSLPGLGGGMPQMSTPEMPDTGGGSDSPSDDAGGDFGSGGTSPAGGAGDGGEGGAPMSSSSPAVGPSVGSGLTVGSPAAGGTPGGGPSGGGMGMMPPMMGGMGGKQDEERKAEERRRVVSRPAPNTEPVFGEVRRETRRRRDPDKKT